MLQPNFACKGMTNWFGRVFLFRWKSGLGLRTVRMSSWHLWAPYKINLGWFWLDGDENQTQWSGFAPALSLFGKTSASGKLWVFAHAMDKTSARNDWMGILGHSSLWWPKKWTGGWKVFELSESKKDELKLLAYEKRESLHVSIQPTRPVAVLHLKSCFSGTGLWRGPTLSCVPHGICCRIYSSAQTSHLLKRISGSENFGLLRVRSATWLILPVVICLSQRLSHAGLSMSRNKVRPRMAHYISYGSLDLRYPTWITLEILELIHANVASTLVEEAFLLDQNQSGSNSCISWVWTTLSGSHGLVLATTLSNVCLINLMVGYVPTMVITGNGESGFDAGEGAWETATTSKEGSRHANYPLPARGGSDEK